MQAAAVVRVTANLAIGGKNRVHARTQRVVLGPLIPTPFCGPRPTATSSIGPELWPRRVDLTDVLAMRRIEYNRTKPRTGPFVNARFGKASPLVAITEIGGEFACGDRVGESIEAIAESGFVSRLEESAVRRPCVSRVVFLVRSIDECLSDR